MAITNKTPNTEKDTGKKPVSFDGGGEVSIDTEEILEELTVKQRKFLQNYILNDEMRGNGTLSYAEAYGYDLSTYPDDDGVYDDDGKQITPSSRTKAYNCCSNNASALLRNHRIQEAKTALLNKSMKEEIVDAEMFWLILYGKGEQKL